MTVPIPKTHPVELAALGERLAPLRLCDAKALRTMGRSLERHGQLSPLTVFVEDDAMQILDGFKRVRCATALGWSKLYARVDEVSGVDAKLRLAELHAGRGLSELEEGWLVRSLYREDGLTQPQIAQRMGRHKSWVWRRLMLVESLVPEVQAQVQLGLLRARAAVAVGRLPRGNQPAASKVVICRGLTVPQAEVLVAEVLDAEDGARDALLERRLHAPATEAAIPGPRPARAPRSEADWMSSDVLRVHEISARLQARLLSTPPSTLAPPAAELIDGALRRLSPVLRSLDAVIARVTSPREGAA
ncbi:MAG: ParB N-terminal domain-containing protein [Myxococcota bacterium]